MKNDLSLDISLLKPLVTKDKLEALQTKVSSVHKSLWNKTCKGNDFLGWLDLPISEQQKLDDITSVANEIQNNADYLISIGIGGSYLGARATIDFLSDSFQKQNVLFFGHHISSDYAASLFSFLKDKDVYVNVISKSGGTTEPAVAFRLIRQELSQKYSDAELQKRIIATTDPEKGILHDLAKKEGYRRFVIPKDVGGRFSVLSDPGLLPIAAAGGDVQALLKGAQSMREMCEKNDNVLENPALSYAAARYLLYQQGKNVEVLSAFEPFFQYIGEWWKQLFGESEGKENKGIYPTAANMTTDLHSLGQYLQEGERMLFETFIHIDQTNADVTIPRIENDPDRLNFMADQSLSDVNEKAHLGTKYAHYDGGLPNMTISMPGRDEFSLGQLYYFFEFAVAVSGLLIDVNPFDQPGVEAYKQNMFALLGKPGFEEQKAKLDRKIKAE